MKKQFFRGHCIDAGTWCDHAKVNYAADGTPFRYCEYGKENCPFAKAEPVKACPYCGSTDVITRVYPYSTSGSVWEFMVKCCKCGATHSKQFRICDCSFENLMEYCNSAQNAWNRRPPKEGNKNEPL